MTKLMTRKIFILFLCLTLFLSGCVASMPQHAIHDGGGSSLDLNHDPDLAISPDGELHKIRRGRYRAAKWALFGAIVAVLVLTDVFLLPVYHRRSNYFPCTRGVVVWCRY